MQTDNAPTKFLVVGGGKMGGAIVGGLIASDAPAARDISAQNFVVVNPGVERREFLTRAYGVACVADVGELSSCSVSPFDVVILAVKPQIMFDVVNRMARMPLFQGGAEGPLFVSIAAGITTDSLAAALPAGAPIVRVMPNLPLLIGQGAAGMCANAAAQLHLPYVQALFDCLGASVVVDETLMDAVCALSGSGPAYVAASIEALVAASIEQGLPPELAERLAIQTFLGTAQLLSEGSQSPAELREAVSSPGGTTLAALDAMNERGLADTFAAGVEAAVRRSKELACI